MSKQDMDMERAQAEAALAEHVSGAIRIEIPKKSEHRFKAMACLGVALVGLAGGMTSQLHNASPQPGMGVQERIELSASLARVWNEPATSASYSAAIRLLRAELYSQIPEARGRIEIFDPTAPVEQEIARIDANLGRVNSQEDWRNARSAEGFYGKARTNQDDGRVTCIAFGWDPSLLIINANLVRVVLHETGHCLDSLRQGPVADVPSGLETNVSQRRQEAYAELFSTSMMNRIGRSPGIAGELSVGYDAEKHLSGSFFTRYDLSAHLVALGEIQGESAPTPGRVTFSGIRDSLTITERIIDAVPIVSSTVRRDTGIAIALEKLINTRSEEGANKVFPNADAAHEWLTERAFLPEIARALAARAEISLAEREGRAPDPSRYEALTADRGDGVAQAVRMMRVNREWMAGLPDATRKIAAEMDIDMRDGFAMVALLHGVDSSQLEAVLDRAVYDPVYEARIEAEGSAAVLADRGIEPTTIVEALNSAPGTVSLPDGQYAIAGHEGWTIRVSGGGGWAIKQDGVFQTLDIDGGYRIPAIVLPSLRTYVDVRDEGGEQRRTPIPATEMVAFMAPGRAAATEYSARPR